jgi:intracellular sulfur oxidation DsrE/DsrF family protein
MNQRFNHLVRAVIVTSACLSIDALAADAPPAPEAGKITIDVPVTLKAANVVFNMDHVAMGGDMPFGMKYMDLLDKKMKADKATGKIIGVFHGPAAFMTLNDQSYNANRHVTTGNPYKGLINALVAEGVQIEECAVSMKGNGWTNKDLLPVVKVNTGAVGRLVELTQQGYVQIQP